MSGPDQPPAKPKRPLYRPEAVAHHANGPSDDGEILRMSPIWLNWSYVLLVSVVASAAVFSALGVVNEYASGPAVVRADGRSDITALAAGTVDAVLVRPGTRVKAGEVLARLYVAEEAADYERSNRQYTLQLAKTLREPSDKGARQELTSLAAQRTLAKKHLDERSIKAPHAGLVSDVRVRSGQHLNPGDLVAALIDDSTAWSVVAMLPGHYRPLLRTGGTLRIELDGYRYAYQEVTIDSIGEEVVGPNEVKRYLGQDVGDTVGVEGPVVLVHARLPSSLFRSDEEEMFQYYDGLHGRAEARVRADSILFTLVPALKALKRALPKLPPIHVGELLKRL